ncbi:MAG: glycosyltransferase [Desulfovibrionaceae bacterium]|nr:glycosyltransferase [Desulfovibrionaceae bacterium]
MLFTIVVATKNVQQSLSDTFSSIISQSYKQIEIVIQDANSSDGSLVAVNETLRRSSLIYSVVSEQDCGVYDAWNKALKRANGEWILFLGAGDTLKDETALNDAVSFLKNVPEGIMYVYTPLELYYPDGALLERVFPSKEEAWAKRVRGMPLPHPATFHRRALFNTHAFDPGFRIAGDYDFVACTLTYDNFLAYERPITRMIAGGLSSSLEHCYDTIIEARQVVKKYFPEFQEGFVGPKTLCYYWLWKNISKIIGKRKAAYMADQINWVWKRSPRFWSRLV